MVQAAQATTLIKRYAGSRLYDTDAARYISLQDVADMVRARESVIVHDATTGRDITRAVLAQIAAGSL